MQDTLNGIEGIHIYADDVLICGNGKDYADAEADHDGKMRRVL